jgi:MFS family permease
MATSAVSAPRGGILDRERTVAKAGFNRWLVPPAALAIHLCIGMAYGFSVFWLPMTKAIGITASKPCPDVVGFATLFSTTCDWRVPEVTVLFTLFFVFLGAAAAIWGGWLERVGPRRAAAYAACCWGGGLLISAYGVSIHQLWVVFLGSGLIGGIGLGLGYISPVSTLVKWFPDRRGMATGMAIMGFGGAAMIGSPLANILMNHFKSASDMGVAQTLVVLGIVYFVYMIGGAFAYRIPPAGWQPEGWTPPAVASAQITRNHVHVRDAHKTPQFWLIWLVLCLNVSAGIGVLAVASPMMQEIFGGMLIHQPGVGFSALDAAQKVQVATVAAGLLALLSLFNILGRFFWASLSDAIGRKATYFTFFGLGIILYGLAPTFAHSGSTILFVIAMCIILSMYGGGFATVPAYLADVFGTQFVGAIHGRLLTAWSVAGIIGPTVVASIRQAEIAAGISSDRLYDVTLYVLCAFLIAGFVCNALVKPVDAKWHISAHDLAEIQRAGQTDVPATGSFGIGMGGFDGAVFVAWALVLVPLGWGIWMTLQTAFKLFV